jgi:predicted transcriptional regulator
MFSRILRIRQSSIYTNPNTEKMMTYMQESIDKHCQKLVERSEIVRKEKILYDASGFEYIYNSNKPSLIIPNVCIIIGLGLIKLYSYLFVKKIE